MKINEEIKIVLSLGGLVILAVAGFLAKPSSTDDILLGDTGFILKPNNTDNILLGDTGINKEKLKNALAGKDTFDVSTTPIIEKSLTENAKNTDNVLKKLKSKDHVIRGYGTNDLKASWKCDDIELDYPVIVDGETVVRKQCLKDKDYKEIKKSLVKQYDNKYEYEGKKADFDINNFAILNAIFQRESEKVVICELKLKEDYKDCLINLLREKEVDVLISE